MACPTCDHTMTCVGESLGEPVFWCPRCGTFRRGAEGAVQAPSLVYRCREYEAVLFPSDVAGFWRGMGIAEAINKPEDRPQ